MVGGEETLGTMSNPQEVYHNLWTAKRLTQNRSKMDLLSRSVLSTTKTRIYSCKSMESIRDQECRKSAGIRGTSATSERLKMIRSTVEAEPSYISERSSHRDSMGQRKVTISYPWSQGADLNMVRMANADSSVSTAMWTTIWTFCKVLHV